MLKIPGVATLGRYYQMDSQRTERHYEILDDFHVSLGSHRLNGGIDVHAVTLDSAIRDRFAGAFIFPGLNAYLRGEPDVYFQAFGHPRTQMRTVPIGSFFEDRWEVRRSFMVELGLRYDPGR